MARESQRGKALFTLLTPVLDLTIQYGAETAMLIQKRNYDSRLIYNNLLRLNTSLDILASNEPEIDEVFQTPTEKFNKWIFS
jgi:hypothetical protein